MPLLATPPTVTTTLPVVAPAGTGATMLVAPQLVGVAVVPLKVTVLVPRVAPKFVPPIVTEIPTAPEVGFRIVMLGADVVTVKLTPLLDRFPTFTRTLPVVAPVGTGAIMLPALQLLGVADVPLKVRVLVPCVDPKFAPLIVTDVPTDPEVGLRLAMCGAEDDLTVTDTLALGFRLPLVPVIVSTYVPRGVDCKVETVSVELPEALTEVGLKLAEIPFGNPFKLSAITPVKPL